ncbi:MAG: phenylalanine--tRNA ligase subunit alpha [Candidatus Caldarchaeum sp.]
MKKELDGIRAQAEREVTATTDEVSLSLVKAKFLGRKGLITELLRKMPEVPASERPEIGRLINETKDFIEGLLQERLSKIRALEQQRRLAEERVDITLPGRRAPIGGKHPVSLMMEEMVGVFVRMGFDIAEGPEIELDYYNFEALNIPKDHPARDMQDTFYVSEDVVLRTHTSPVQIRVMEKQSPPVKAIAPGKVFRCDSDISHTPMFHQIEGFLVDERVTFGDLKGVLTEFVRQVFGEGTRVRFRPSFFPFTEPSAEVDIECVFCKGRGCRVCKSSGWLEILGCGMVDPEVFKSVGYDPARYRGFAFGLGVERVTMLKYGVGDIRLFFDNDVRFLRQFRGYYPRF